METIKAVLDMVKAAMARCRVAKTQEEAFQSVLVTVEGTITAIETTAQQANQGLQRLEAAMVNLEARIQGAASTKKKASMAESRAVQGLKMPVSDKSVFKTWNGKLINLRA